MFVDIETAPVQAEWADLSVEMQAEWTRKARLIRHTGDEQPDPAAMYGERAGIYSEFARIVCIGFGSMYNSATGWKLRLKAIAGEDEKKILQEFNNVIARIIGLQGDIRFCGHNIKEFDIPFICRRSVINNVPLPPALQLSGKKPWEVQHIDTMELWKFGDVKHYTSLSLLATILGIPSPKTDMDGSQVGEVFWKDKDLDRISKYCMNDVLTAARVYLRLKGIDNIDLQPDHADV
ncbi:3'-5' exonuclease [Nemorincola caseinilytica]|uniref:3'-5' exonuclease n=1 Tax=Nemorincola caseinilytica TaxID=2054315 RepID=A0ABP8NAG0_9BACT